MFFKYKITFLWCCRDSISEDIIDFIASFFCGLSKVIVLDSRITHYVICVLIKIINTKGLLILASLRLNVECVILEFNVLNSRITHCIICF